MVVGDDGQDRAFSRFWMLVARGASWPGSRRAPARAPCPPPDFQSGVAQPERCAFEIKAREMPLLVAAPVPCLRARADIVAEHHRHVDAGQHRRPPAPSRPPARARARSGIGQARDLLDRVADVEHGDVQLVVQPLQLGQDLVPCARWSSAASGSSISSRRGLRGQRARDRHALALAARQLARCAAPAGGRCPAARSRCIAARSPALRRGARLQAVVEVAAHVQVRRTGWPPGTRSRAAAPVRRHEHAARVVLPAVSPSIATQAPAARSRPASAAQQRGLARSPRGRTARVTPRAGSARSTSSVKLGARQRAGGRGVGRCSAPSA